MSLRIEIPHEPTSPGDDEIMTDTRPKLRAWITERGALVVTDRTGHELAMTRADLRDVTGQLKAMGYDVEGRWWEVTGGVEMAWVRPVT